ILGVSIGFPAMFAAIAFGLGGVLRPHPGILVALHWIGAAYLLWLAWRVAVARPARDGAGAATADRRRRPLRFTEAALFQWANPKAWLAAMSAVAAYATVGDHVAPVQVLVLTALFLLICIPTTMMWTSIGAGTALLLRTDRQMRLFNLGMALLLVASLAPMLLEP
ncbi:MAG TPA: LysE family translocator, partial [Acetobacteraceae bacterium]|nr:LysE family translocator [Acetobacteraceae bacterium]